MRTPHLGRSARLAAAASMTVAIAGFAFAPAAMATAPSPSTSPTASPSPTVSPSPTASPSPSQSPDDKPTAPPPGTVDASLTMKVEDTYKPGEIGAIKVAVRSDKPASGYHLDIKWPSHLPMFEVPKHDGWKCDFGYPRLQCDWAGAPTANPGEVWVAFKFPKRAGYRAKVSAHVTVKGDENPENNTVVRNLVVGSAPENHGRITGRIWNDANGNGRQDAGEKGVAGAKVAAWLHRPKTDGVVVASTITGPSGGYVFDRLRPTEGYDYTYSVLLATPDKTWRMTKTNIGSDATDSDMFAPEPRGPIDEDWALKVLGKKAGQANVGFQFMVEAPAAKTAVVDGGLVKVSTGEGTGGDDDGTLPKTGASTGWILGAGGLLLASGLGLTLVARRRRILA